jgi:hypothetical protein
MAIFHQDVSSISRGRGQSAVAAAAYRGCTRMTDQRTGIVSDFTNKSDHVDGVTFGRWARGSEALWNAAEAAEKHPRAQVAREIKLAIPHELSPKGRFRLCLGFCLSLVDKHGVAGTLNIHSGRNPLNTHAHIMITTRVVVDGVFGAKTRELDCRPTSGQHLGAMREDWERRVNSALAREGFAARVDRRSHKDKARDGGLWVEPMEHLGPDRAEAERKGRTTPAGARNRQRAAERAALIPLLQQRNALDHQIADTLRRRERTAALRPTATSVRPTASSPRMTDAALSTFIDRMLAPTPLMSRVPVAEEFIAQAQAFQPVGWPDDIGPRLKRSLRGRRRDSARRLVRVFQESAKRAAGSVATDITKLISFIADVFTRDERER